jgi:three-Cys-motif partner protein
MLGNLARFGGDKLAYMDFYCGPGKYRDGSPSTPVLVLTQAMTSPTLQQKLVVLFNDKEQGHIDALKASIAAVPGIGGLKHEITYLCTEVGQAFEDHFKGTSIVPTFTFVDPFGYKGVTLELLKAMLKDFGCDLVLFFSGSASE